MRFLKALLVESRRFLSILLMPWTLVLLLCAGCSWLALGIMDLQAILVPVLKLFSLAKVLALKLVPGGLLALVVVASTKLLSVYGELATLVGGFIAGIVSSWKAWTVKKSLRHGARFAATTSARFVLFNGLTNFLFGRERKGLKRLPGYLKSKLAASFLGRTVIWWKSSSEKTKRLSTGILLCIVLVIAGQAMLGLSILLFDLIWELLLWMLRGLAKVWRWIAPLIMRMLPNTLGNFITRKLLPALAEIVPVIRDDHRLMYMRFNVNRHIRAFKYRIYRYSRIRRSPLRTKLRSVVPRGIRQRKGSIVEKAIVDEAIVENATAEKALVDKAVDDSEKS